VRRWGYWREEGAMSSRTRQQSRLFLAASLTTMAAALAGPAYADGAGTHVGKAHFAVSCSAPAQQQFDRAVAMLHSFWYPEAAKAFAAIGDTDPSCAMAQWGVAMSVWYPLWYPPSEAMLTTGAAAVDKARSIGAKTDRERDYIEAIATFYKDWRTVDHRARAIAYEKAMAQVYQRYPDDREAGIFYALALDATAPPTDKSYANQRKAAEILEQAHGAEPDHPGIAHYLIHSYDSATLAEQGLPAARSYAALAPAVPHALHMPSHIFTRLGLWQESIASNAAGNEKARAYAEKTEGPGAFDGETVHTMDYLEYAYLQGAQDEAAKRVVDGLASLRKGPSILVTAYAVAAIPARYALERRAWAEAAVLPMPDTPIAWNRFPWAEGLNAYARALGASRSGDQAAAEREIARLKLLEDELVAAKDKYWADQVEVQRLAASGMAKRAQGDDAEAVRLVRAAADLEAGMDKHPVTPAAILPARELLADLLLELDRPADALAEYERSLAAEPRRFRSLYGAARAAQRSETPDKARTFYTQLVAQCDKADTARPELTEAKAFLAK
jgi:hypothetical protein